MTQLPRTPQGRSQTNTAGGGQVGLRPNIYHLWSEK